MNNSTQPIELKNVNISIPDRILVENLNITLKTKEFVAILGQNGCGKSLTLHTIAGLREPSSGEIFLEGKEMKDFKRKEIAKKLGLLTQDSDDVFPSTVFDSVLIGRHPHIGIFNNESNEDLQIVKKALDRVGLYELKDREVNSLSGGEKRRLNIAQVIAQDPNIYLLDEPTNHLDPFHQLQILNIFHTIVKKKCTIIATMHDINLIYRFADRCLLIFENHNWLLGNKKEVLTEENLSELYKTKIQKNQINDQTFFTTN
ncbi:MAG: ABC transporter ATP-binding protein [Pseudomonadota bacterium]|nr:ABC transporter ATP-binding protein [Pseudomonadota bacterium]